MKSFNADQVTLGFVGVGAIGGRIVRRLRDHGNQISAYEALFPYLPVWHVTYIGE